MLPSGNLLAATTGARTFELTPRLEVVRSFVHPTLNEAVFSFPTTSGITYNPDTASVWWMNVEFDRIGSFPVVVRVLLLEGDLDGVATGRRIEVPFVGGGDSGGRAVRRALRASRAALLLRATGRVQSTRCAPRSCGQSIRPVRS